MCGFWIFYWEPGLPFKVLLITWAHIHSFGWANGNNTTKAKEEEKEHGAFQFSADEHEILTQTNQNEIEWNKFSLFFHSFTSRFNPFGDARNKTHCNRFGMHCNGWVFQLNSASVVNKERSFFVFFFWCAKNKWKEEERANDAITKCGKRKVKLQCNFFSRIGLNVIHQVSRIESIFNSFLLFILCARQTNGRKKGHPFIRNQICVQYTKRFDGLSKSKCGKSNLYASHTGPNLYTHIHTLTHVRTLVSRIYDFKSMQLFTEWKATPVFTYPHSLRETIR